MTKTGCLALFFVLNFTNRIICQTISVNLSPDSTHTEIIEGRLTYNHRELIIKLWDYNLNNIFDDYEEDVIEIIDIKTQQISVSKVKENNSLNLCGEMIEIQFEGGNNILIGPAALNSINYGLKVWNSLPKSFVIRELFSDTIVTQETILTHDDELVFISFWAAFCEPCIREMPYFRAYLESNSQKIKFVHVCIDEDSTNAKAIIQKNSPPGIYAYCTRADMESLNAYYFPYGLLYKNDGTLISCFNGANALFNYLMNDK